MIAPTQIIPITIKIQVILYTDCFYAKEIQVEKIYNYLNAFLDKGYAFGGINRNKTARLGGERCRE